MWRSFETDPPPQDGRKVLAWARYVMDEYDEDDRLIARGNVSDFPVILQSCPPFEGWMETGGRMVQNATYLYWQDIEPPKGARVT